jgi:acyl-coenzyme A thioesterase PaaI-like protein
MDIPATIDAHMPGPSEFHHDCVVCGAGNPGGLQLRYEIGPDGVATSSWLPSQSYQSYPDRIHGGVLAMLLDSAMVHALWSRGVAGVTVEMKIRYLRSVDWFSPVRITGEVLASRHGLHLCRATLSQHDAHCAQADAKFLSKPNPASTPS